MTHWTELEPKPAAIRPFHVELSPDLEARFLAWLDENGFPSWPDNVRYLRAAWADGWSYRCEQLIDERPPRVPAEVRPLSVTLDITVDPFLGDIETEQHVRSILEAAGVNFAAPCDDLLPRRSPADECIVEHERFFPTSAVARRRDDFFSRADAAATPPAAARAESDPCVPGGSRASSESGLRAPHAGGTRGPGFLEECVRDVLTRAPWPLTSFEIATRVLKGHPNRWAAVSIRRGVSKLADRGVLHVVDCDGLSPESAPCFRYELGEAA